MTPIANKPPSFWLDRLSSVKLTLVCLAFAMGLVILGTLAQVRMGTFAAQKEFFNSLWIFVRFGGVKVPMFPGGLAIGAVWMVNLVAAFFTQFTFRRRDAGILLSHFGLILLLAGQFLTQTLAKESNMPIELGQSLNYSESPREMELAVVMTSDADTDEVTSIPYTIFSRERQIQPPTLPFSLVIRKFFPNAQIRMAAPGETTLATQGVGTRVSVQELPPLTSDDDTNNVSAYIEVLQRDGRSLGIWLVSAGLGAPQSFQIDNKDYQLYIRPRRQYYPFSLTLKEFHHDIYPGTDIPKNFSSVVGLLNPAKKESRDALIYMNHPLRYEGKTFYQASFGKEDRLSVFQVVENPVAWSPYVSCALIILGLLIQFQFHLFEFIRKRA